MATRRTAPEAPRLHFVGGKGGVGKTTCAAAWGIASARAGARVLVASTDPAPSLGDAYTMPLSGRPRPVPLRGASLHAVEIRGSAALHRWIQERKALLRSIAVQGTWLDDEDVDRLLALNLPGIDELSALFEIDRLAAAGRYDEIIIDTAPTGHTLRLLAMPETLAGAAGVFDLMREKGRTVEAALRGRWTPRGEDRLVEELATLARRLGRIIRDPARARVSWVTIPDPVALAETVRALDALGRAGIAVSTIVANRMTPEPSSACGRCDARRAFERRSLRSLDTRLAVLHVPDHHPEPQGLPRLSRIARDLASEADTATSTARLTRWRARLPWDTVAKPDEAVGDTTRLVLIGGKGGVGKSTCAAAIALAASQRWPERRTLLLSADPAGSLGDVLQRDVDDEPRRVRDAAGQLFVRELDASRVLAALREEYRAAIGQAFDRWTHGSPVDASHDRSVMQALIELAPPGLDELVAVVQVSEALVSEKAAWDLVVMDTAPTGHAIRLLETPELLHEWTRALMSIVLKYQAVASIGRIGSMLLELSRGLGRLRDLLTDGRRAAFVIVTRPAALPRLETLRLRRTLQRIGIHVPCVVVNAYGRGTCDTCERTARAERAELEALAGGLARRRPPRLVAAPSDVPPPTGVRGLAAWGRAWRATGPGKR